MERKFDLSVIIPVFNGEKFIERCINSVKKNESDIEIIVVNDGSCDGTLEKLSFFEDVKVINLEINHGISFARNVGLKNSCGRYFTFVDSDDFIADFMFDKLLDLAFTNDLDVCGCNYYEVYGNKFFKSKYNYSGDLYCNGDVVQNIIEDKLSLTVWGKIYKNKDIYFNENLKINEDYVFSINYFVNASRCMFINDYLYNYCRNNNSVTSNYCCKDVFENDYVQCVDQKFLNNKFFSDFANLHELKKVHLYSLCLDKKNRYYYLKKYVDKSRLKNIKNKSFYVRVEVFVFSLSIRLHLLLFPLYNCIKKLKRGI